MRNYVLIISLGSWLILKLEFLEPLMWSYGFNYYLLRRFADFLEYTLSVAKVDSRSYFLLYFNFIFTYSFLFICLQAFVQSMTFLIYYICLQTFLQFSEFYVTRTYSLSISKS